jgi:hypothetical protein
MRGLRILPASSQSGPRRPNLRIPSIKGTEILISNPGTIHPWRFMAASVIVSMSRSDPIKGEI